MFKRHIAYWKGYPTPPVFFSKKPYIVKSNRISAIELWISLYKSPRLEENVRALRFNLDNPHISKINILLEDPQIKLEKDIAFNPKVSITIVEKKWRTKYSEFINLINASSDNINIIVNSDIVLSYDSLDKIQGISKDELIILTRHEVDDNSNTMEEFVKTASFTTNFASSDTWIFRGRPPILADIYLGIPGCENMFIMEFVGQDYKVYNLGKIIPSYHLQKNKNTQGSYDFTYYLSKMFKLTYVEAQSSLDEKIETPTSIEEVETTLGKAITDLTNLFNEELRGYKTLIDIYQTTLSIQTEDIQNDIIEASKREINDKVEVIYNEQLKHKTEELHLKLEEYEIEFTKKLKEELQEKFNDMYESELFLKKKSLSEQLAKEEAEFRNKLELSQQLIIVEYKASKIKEINNELSINNEKMIQKLRDEMKVERDRLNGSLMQEMTLKKEEYERELSLTFEANDRVYKDKKNELQKAHKIEIDKLKDEIALIKSQITELREEEETLREKNQLFLSKIDETCEEYKENRTRQIEDSLSEVKSKLLKEEEFLHSTILSHNMEIEKSYEQSVVEKKGDLDTLNSLFAEKREVLQREFEKFQVTIKNGENTLNQEYEKKKEGLCVELLNLKDTKLSQIFKEIDDVKATQESDLKTQLETLKKTTESEMVTFNKKISDEKKNILKDLEDYKNSEILKVKNSIEQYSQKCKNAVETEIVKYKASQEKSIDSKLELYETNKKDELNAKLVSRQKQLDESLLEYVKNIELRMKEEHSKLENDQEIAIKCWNDNYISEQARLNRLRTEAIDTHALISKETDLIIEDSRQKIASNIEIFNSDYSAKIARVREKLEQVKGKILIEHEQLRAKEIEKLEKLAKEKKTTLEREEKERYDELLKMYSNKKTDIENEIETLRSENLIKIISETNQKRDELNSELEDELKTFREVEIETIRKEIENNVMAKLEKTIKERDNQDLKERESERRQFNEYMDNLRQTEIGIIQQTKESTIARLDTRITELRKQLFELEKNLRTAKE